ncbi:MAG: hypothetical protein UMU75_04395 [Halomonas sp.]|nr:hypothetical protein [Halomonas sp.]
MTMSPRAIDNIAKSLEDNLGRTALHSASDQQLDSTEALLGIWIGRVQEARDERRINVIGQNGNDGDHYARVNGDTA